MKNRNTTGPFWFIFENILWTGILAIWMLNGAFRILPGCTLATSRMIYWMIAGVCLVLGICLTIERRRNSLSVFVNVVTAAVLYGWLTYHRTFPTAFSVAFGIAVVLCGIYVALVLAIHFKNPLSNFAACLTHALLGARTIAVCCMSVVWLTILGSVLFGNALLSPGVAATLPAQQDVYSDADNMAVLENLREEKWATLNTRQRLEVMQQIANMEAVHLGITHELNVGAEAMAERHLGYYTDSTHEIRISLDSLEYSEPEEVLNTLCHEAYHAYQHRLCDAYDNVGEEYQDLLVFSAARAYKHNFANYPDPDVDFDKYYSAACEANARSYAKTAVARYMAKLEDSVG